MNYLLKNAISYSVLTILSSLLLGCIGKQNGNEIDVSSDTTRIIQTVLSNDRLVLDVIRSFKEDSMKIVTGSVVKKGYRFTFAGKPVKVVSISGDYYQIHEEHRRELYVSVQSIKLFSKDSASVSFIFHGGNAIEDYQLKKCNQRWFITGYRFGKF